MDDASENYTDWLTLKLPLNIFKNFFEPLFFLLNFFEHYSIFLNTMLCMVSGVLVVALVERWTRDRKGAGSTPGRGDIKSTRSTQPSIPPR